MTGMDDLIAWLRAQLDDDERVAQDAVGTPAGNLRVHLGMSLWGPRDVGGPELPSVWEQDKYVIARDLSDEHATHIARWDPARVLAEVDAKRRILDLHATIWRVIGWLDEDREETYEELPVCVFCVPKHSHFSRRADVPVGACLTVQLLAQPYAGRDGWREEWRAEQP